LRTSIQYIKVTFFQTSIHAASGGTNSPHENPEEYKMKFLWISFLYSSHAKHRSS